jgi:hypothetical protein
MTEIMNNNFRTVQKQALEVCIEDTVSFMDMYLRIQKHPKSALIFNGLIAHASMFVVENHHCLTTLIPETKSIFSPSFSELLRQSRHRGKLLDSSNKSIDDMTAELISIAKRQREIVLEPHKGLLGAIKRALQPDIGLSFYDNHIFTTTHTVVFAFGKEREFSESAFAFGKEIGVYISTVFRLLQIEIPSSVTKPIELPGKIEMRDIKYESLYNRGALDACYIEISAGLILILANLNFIIYILSGLLPASSHLLFRLKFITAFHANSSINLLQRKLITSKTSPTSVTFFKEALGNDDSKWLRNRKRMPLRNLLVHYLPDEQLISKLPPTASRFDAIEYYSGGLSFTDVNNLLDRNITHLASLLEVFFNLNGDPFWFGKVE